MKYVLLGLAISLFFVGSLFAGITIPPSGGDVTTITLSGATGDCVQISGSTMTGPLKFATNVSGQIVFMSSLEDPEGSITTQALVTVTNGYTVATGLTWTNSTATVTNAIEGLFANSTNVNSVLSYIIAVNSTQYHLFKASNSFYHISASTVDQSLVNCASNALTTVAGTYLGVGSFIGSGVATINITTNTPFVVYTNSTYSVITNVIHSTSNDFFYVLNGVTNSIAGGAGTTNASGITVVFSPTNYTAAGNAESHFQGIDIALPVLSNAVIVDAAARDTAQFANSVDWAGAVGVPYSTTTSGSNWFTSTTIPGLSFTTDISATGADFTAMPTSADTPDGSDPTALMNVDYLSVMLTNGFIHSLTNQLHILGVF